MFRIAVRGVREHLVRFALSVLAVTLGVAFVAGTLSLRQMLSSTFHDIVATSVRADAYVRVPGAGSAVGPGSATADAGNQGLPVTLADRLESVDGVRAAFPSLQGPTVLVGADGTAVRSGQAPSFGMAFDPSDATSATLVGRAPARADEVVVEQHALARSGLHVGQDTKVLVGGQIRPVTVVGSLDWGSATAGATLVFFDRATAQAAFAPDGRVPTIAVYADPAAHLTQAQLVDRIRSTAQAGGGQAITADTLRTETTASIDSSLGFVSTFLLVFAALALFVGAFIIANTFAMTVRQRLREFALLRAVGASPLQVFTSVVVQAAVVGLLGSAVGIAVGLGLVAGLRLVLARMGMSLAGTIPLTAQTVVASVLIGTVVSMLASALPARRAALVPPVEAMRDELVVRDRSMVGRAIAGAVLLLAGAGAAGWVAWRPGTTQAGTLLGVGAGAVLVGVLALGPVIAPATIRLLAAPLVALVRPLGRLARGNVTRNPRRTANTAGALTIGMALVGAAAVLAASTQASVSTLVSKEIHTDFVLRTDPTQTIGAQVGDKVRALPDVASAYALPWGTALAATSSTPTKADGVYVSGTAPAMLGTVLVPTQQHGDAPGALRAGEAVVDVRLADDRGWHVGDRLTLVGSAGTVTTRIGATLRSDTIGKGVLVSPSVLDTLVVPTQQRDSTMLVTARPGVDPASLRADLVTVVKPYLVVSVMDSGEFVSSLANQVNQVLVILYALLGLSIAIAALGIVNTLALSVIERTREIGLLRAVGLGRVQLAGTVTIESVLTAVSGTAVGLAVGVGLAATLPRVYADQGLSTLAVPWMSLFGMLALAVLVGVFAAVWPAVRAARLRVLDAVSYE